MAIMQGFATTFEGLIAGKLLLGFGANLQLISSSPFGSKGNQHRLFISFITAVASQCAGSGLISAYLPAVLDQIGFNTSRDKALINRIINIWSWVVGVSAALLIPKVKRRQVFLFCTSGMLAIFMVWTILSARYYSTPSRGLGIGVVAMIFVKYINPIGLQNISWKYSIIQTVFIAVLLVVLYFTFVETHGLTLEEITVKFDGEDEFATAVMVESMKMGKQAPVSEHAEAVKTF